MTSQAFARWLRLSSTERQPLVMGVLNVTPDSFSDGGKFSDVTAAVGRAVAMVTAGADLIDIGGESTRPGSSPVPVDEQLSRVIPVLQSLRELNLPVTYSIDTTRAPVAEAALNFGASVVNDISAGRDDPAMLAMVARRHVAIILMHMQGTPATMQLNPTYRDVATEVSEFLRERMNSAATVGIDPADVLLDPGIGFGKTVEQNLQLLRHLRDLATIGPPLVVGVSRKGFIGTVTGEEAPEHRQFGTAAAVAWSIANGTAIVRVHDVEPMVRVVRMVRAIQGKQDMKQEPRA